MSAASYLNTPTRPPTLVAPARPVPLPSGRAMDLTTPLVMGIVNVTPDSFSDGGRYFEREAALEAARQLVVEGAGILDIGGESTRPGAERVPVADELQRVIPVIEALVTEGCQVPISIDTRKAEVARAALAAGASLVNDVTGLSDPGMAAAAADAGAALVIGHIQGEPGTMQRDPRYDDVVAEVRESLARARSRAMEAGVAPDAILVDPGIGFGKTLAHNLALLANLHSLTPLGPVVIGVSRKSMLGTILQGRPVDERLSGGLGAAVWSALAGASVVRTHDVRATSDALRVTWTIFQAGHASGGERTSTGVA